MTFKVTHMNMTELGQLFGVSSHQVGKWLKELGLRKKDGSPSSEAYNRQLIRCNFNENGTYNWNAERTVAFLEESGHERIPNPPPELVAPPLLVGPFTLKKAENDCWHLVGPEREVAISVTGHSNAQVVGKILNLAHTSGYLDRLLNQSIH